MTDVMNYHYHPITLAFTGATKARQSPLNPEEYLLPRGATRVQPPAKEVGKALVWKSGVWAQVPDHRGETWWKSYGTPVTITELGDPEELGWYPVEPILSLGDLKAAKQRALAEKRWEVEVGGFTFNGISLPSDATMASKISGTMSLMQLDPGTATVDWEVSEGVWQTFDQPTIQAIGVALALHIKSTFDHKQDLAKAIAGAKNETELNAIDISAGW